MRSKSLLNEVEAIYEERHEQNEAAAAAGNNNFNQQPHLILNYKDKSMIDEACNLIIHHVKRQTSIHKDDKQKIKQLLRQFVPDLFATPRGDLSDDELDDAVETDEKSKPSNNVFKDLDLNKQQQQQLQQQPPPPPPPPQPPQQQQQQKDKTEQTDDKADGQSSVPNDNGSTGQNGQKPANLMLNTDPDDCYSLFFVNSNWYLFFRLHYILCERLGKMYERATILAAEEAKEKLDRKESTAVALRLKPNSKFCGLMMIDFVNFLITFNNILITFLIF